MMHGLKLVLYNSTCKKIAVWRQLDFHAHMCHMRQF